MLIVTLLSTVSGGIEHRVQRLSRLLPAVAPMMLIVTLLFAVSGGGGLCVQRLSRLLPTVALVRGGAPSRNTASVRIFYFQFFLMKLANSLYSTSVGL